MNVGARVLLVDDQELFREGIANLLAAQPDFEVVGQAGDGEAGVQLARELKPDLILMDVNMPRLGGVAATQQIHETNPEIPIVMLTVSDADSDLFEAIKAGALGYLLKNSRAQTLFEMLRGVLRGEAALSPTIASRVLAEFAYRRGTILEPTPEGLDAALTDRELAVLQEIVTGRSNHEIAETLKIAESTVKRHLHNILTKLQLHSRAQAVAFALRTGLARSDR